MSKNEKKRILLVEDEPHMAFSLQFNLQQEGFHVDPAVDGQIAIDMYDQRPAHYDLVILDVMLPNRDGYAVAKHIRQSDDQTHILMLTALGKTEQRLKGFEAGIDDYVTKPFHLDELLMRVKRMVHRSTYFDRPDTTDATASLGIHTYGSFELDMENLRLAGPAGDFKLTSLEAEVLREFFLHPGKVLSRQYLLNEVWKMTSDIETRTVDNFVARLRRYIEADPANPTLLISIRGRGYKLKA